MPKSGYGYVAESLRDNRWVFLCPTCPRPVTKTDDLDVPALELRGDKWVCPVCKTEVKDRDLYG